MLLVDSKGMASFLSALNDVDDTSRKVVEPLAGAAALAFAAPSPAAALAAVAASAHTAAGADAAAAAARANQVANVKTSISKKKKLPVSPLPPKLPGSLVRSYSRACLSPLPLWLDNWAPAFLLRPLIYSQLKELRRIDTMLVSYQYDFLFYFLHV